MTEIVDMTSEEFRQFDLEFNRADLDPDAESRRILGDGRPVIINWGHPCLGLKLDGKLISVNSTYFTRRPRRNAWGRYLNCYLAYTLPAFRRQGYASQLMAHNEQKAIAGGWSRLKSLAGSWAGVRLHMRFGHHFYGIGKRGAIAVDTPLAAGMEFPEGIPIEVRNAVAIPKRMERAELHLALTGPLFKQSVVDEGEIKDVLDKYYARLRS